MLCKHLINGSCCDMAVLFTIISTIPSCRFRFRGQTLFCKRYFCSCFQPEISTAAPGTLVMSAGLWTKPLFPHPLQKLRASGSGSRLPQSRKNFSQRVQEPRLSFYPGCSRAGGVHLPHEEDIWTVLSLWQSALHRQRRP